jgi:hypothetical protein
MVFDHAGRYLYIATAEGFVFPYDVATGTYSEPYNLGGSLNGMDIAPDDSFLLVAQSCTGAAEACMQKLELGSGTVTNITFPLANELSSSGSWDVGIASNGLAIFTSCNAVHQLDLSTNIVAPRRDAPFALSYSVMISKSADASGFCLADTYDSSGPLFTYTSSTDTFSSAYKDNSFSLSALATAVSRNGALIGLSTFQNAWLSSAPGAAVIHRYGNIDSGIAFDAVRDRFYGVDTSTRQIVGYDTGNFQPVLQINIGQTIAAGTATFGEGTLVASPDGQFVALRTSTATRVYSTGSPVATPTPAPLPTPGRLRNISTRALVQTGEDVVIGGFIIKGTAPKTILLRAMGPSLAAYHVPGVLQDPMLELHDETGTLIGSNNNWGDVQRTQIQQTGYAPADPREAAYLTTLAPCAYTVIVRGNNNTTGVALVEVYDLSLTSFSALCNISTRAFVGSGDYVAIAGVIVAEASKQVIVRGIGPSLTAYGITNPLADPMLELHNANGTMIAANDNWADTERAAVMATGLAPSDYREAAIIAFLAQGNYTAILKGKNNSTGVGLVECYTLPY